ncbi:energy transducer TonB [Spirochaeta africana]|uniref:TonB family protein n=1 Tax=Spirochaeta africana (strain ATCC 700263 / DSM 8902 / Z-7692) TaxID=889378 RepID=H9ULH6_SPIAZ|nr:energy transducer TonB [Spirochaeta africana]AFG38369.1 TonB family protein [Spirochaeta africana DSM 8902]
MKRLRWILLIAAALLHLLLFVTVRLNTRAAAEDIERAEVFKLVDARELLPPEPEPEPELPPPPAPEPDVIEIEVQEGPAEEYQETEQTVVEVGTPAESAEPEYLPQHRISRIPEIPTRQILDRIVYPQMARRQGIEGTVFLELFIDEHGTIRAVEVLRDPGFGFAEAAVAALDGISVRPAEANGIPVAVRYRYPVRFQLR